MDALRYGDDYGEEAAATQNAVQLIAFSIGEQTYGVEITTVREIRAWNGATPLPNTREFVRGRDQPARHDRADLRSPRALRRRADGADQEPCRRRDVGRREVGGDAGRCGVATSSR